jgi:PDZ domain-containing protein
LRFKVLSGTGVLLAVALLVSSLVSIPYYALTPGSAQSVLRLIGLPPAKTHDHKGSVDLVDVEITSMRAIDWIYFELDPSASIYSSAAIRGPETSAQYNTEGIVDMADAQQAATVVALDRLGYHVAATPAGALLYALQPGSPAEQTLSVGDVVTALDSTPVRSAIGLGSALQAKKPGERVTFRFHSYSAAAVHSAAMTLGVWRVEGKGSNAQLLCRPFGSPSRYPVAELFSEHGQIGLPPKGQHGHPVACMGSLGTEDWYRVSGLPFAVDLNSEGIVGPSAGLAFTLGLMQKLDRYDLTGGLKVAATGTMSINGQVGAIGGVEQKTIAVRASGAAVFFVPPANYKRAKAYAGPHLKVYAVSSIDQVLGILERYGGRVARP